MLTSKEDLATTRPRAPYSFRIKSAVTRDGFLLAREVEALGDAGAYADHVVGTAWHLVMLAQGPYRIPNPRAEARVVYTNNGHFGCMRGYGMAEFSFASESHMDTIADTLGMDPATFRLQNLCREGEPILSTQRLRAVNIRETMEAALAASGYWEKKGRLAPGRGIGIANLIHSTGLLGASATVRVNEDASISVLSATVNIGTGTHTGLCQIAAEVLGVPAERVHTTALDSDGAPWDLGSIASRTIYDVGNAVRMAAEDLQSQISRLAARVLRCPTDEVVSEGGCYSCAGGNEAIPLAKLTAMVAGGAQSPLIGYGSWLAMPPLAEPVGEGFGEAPVGTFIFGTHVAEVEVDRETGLVQVTNLTAAHDVGRAVNPTCVEGQVQGGAAQGIGFGLYEELALREGRVVNGSFLDYKVPTALDVPCVVTELIEQGDTTGPFGAKGVGEVPLMPPAPAIANAIFDATGARVRDLPISPERLYRALVAVEERN